MFGLVMTPAATPIKGHVPDTPPEGYADLAKKLGINASVVAGGTMSKVAAFQHALSLLGLRQYNDGDVKRYLNRQYEWPDWRPFINTRSRFAGIPWGWRPLRDADCVARGVWLDGDKDYRFGGIDRNDTWCKWTRKQNHMIMAGKETYSKPIPMPVLLTVDRISSQFPSARFYVSDEMKQLDIPKDPFLIVVYEGKEFIIERWNEPSFKG